MTWLSREISFLLARLITNFFAVLAVTQLLENGIVLPERGSDRFWLATFSVAAALAILNSYVRPALELVLKPISCLLKLLTFGLSHFVISAVVFWAATILVDDFTIVDVSTALLGTLIVAAVGVFGSLVFGGRSTDE
jgi:uncharacterized membrane protein YvlD (DUF360 family)